jgi:hypothetical protein
MKTKAISATSRNKHTDTAEPWTQMIEDAEQLAKEGKPHYIEEQGAQYEGLTVWFNTMAASVGGQILTSDNNVLGGFGTRSFRYHSSWVFELIGTAHGRFCQVVCRSRNLQLPGDARATRVAGPRMWRGS